MLFRIRSLSRVKAAPNTVPLASILDPVPMVIIITYLGHMVKGFLPRRRFAGETPALQLVIIAIVTKSERE